MNKSVQRKLFRQLREDYIAQSDSAKLQSQLASTLADFLRAEQHAGLHDRFEQFGRTHQKNLHQQNKPNQATWAAYRALPGEANLDPLFFQMKDVNWVFPKVINSGLKFFKPDSMNDFEVNSWGIAEPIVSRSQEVALNEISGFLIPAVAFDRQGNRLGMGKGYYDRALSGLTTIKVGVAYQVQISKEELPTEAHDIGMDFIATDTELISVGEPSLERTAL